MIGKLEHTELKSSLKAQLEAQVKTKHSEELSYQTLCLNKDGTKSKHLKLFAKKLDLRKGFNLFKTDSQALEDTKVSNLEWIIKSI